MSCRQEETGWRPQPLQDALTAGTSTAQTARSSRARVAPPLAAFFSGPGRLVHNIDSNASRFRFCNQHRGTIFASLLEKLGQLGGALCKHLPTRAVNCVTHPLILSLPRTRHSQAGLRDRSAHRGGQCRRRALAASNPGSGCRHVRRGNGPVAVVGTQHAWRCGDEAWRPGGLPRRGPWLRPPCSSPRRSTTAR